MKTWYFFFFYRYSAYNNFENFMSLDSLHKRNLKLNPADLIHCSTTRPKYNESNLYLYASEKIAEKIYSAGGNIAVQKPIDFSVVFRISF